jgi:hypothetical protein
MTPNDTFGADAEGSQASHSFAHRQPTILLLAFPLLVLALTGCRLVDIIKLRPKPPTVVAVPSVLLLPNRMASILS